MRKYVCKFNVSCLRQVYASCSDVVNPTFCPVEPAAHNGWNWLAAARLHSPDGEKVQPGFMYETVLVE